MCRHKAHLFFKTQPIMKNHLLRMSLVAATVVALGSTATPLFAQTLKIIGATFIDAPPGRDKKLVPFAAGPSQEKAEVHAVLSVSKGLLVDMAGLSRDQAVSATGMHDNKSTITLGSVDVSSFPRVSADGKSMLISLSVSRLSDKPVAAINFAGTLKVRMASSTSTKSGKFTAKSGTLLDLGLGEIKVAKLDGNTVVIEGGSALERISALKFISADGKANAGENVGSGRMNERFELTYRFPVSLTDGRIEAAMYEGLETTDIPVRLTITRPY